MKHIMIQYLIEIALIVVLSYVASLYLPWWIVAVVAAVVSFLYNTKTLSFIAGFIAIALLWGGVAYQLSVANEHILAEKVAAIISSGDALGAMGLVVLTAVLGGLLGGLGAWTGQLGRNIVTAKFT